MSEIVSIIKAAMQSCGLSQRELAARLGKTESEVSRWLSGKMGISPKNLKKIEEVLGVSLEQRTEGADAPCEPVPARRGGRNIGIVLAGGIGSRVGAGMPKQFVEILGKPVLAYTLEIYQNHPEIDAIEVVCVKSYYDYLQEMVQRYGLTKVRWICLGGATFQDSVYNGIQNLVGEIDDRDTVMIHYGAAPFTSARILSDAIRVCREKGNAVSVTPCYQLIGSNDEDGTSRRWVDRDQLIQIACPQCFQFGFIRDLYEEAIEKNLLSRVEPHTTSLMYLMGKTLYQSYGDQTNVKITTKEDLELFEGFVLARLRKEGKIKVK